MAHLRKPDGRALFVALLAVLVVASVSVLAPAWLSRNGGFVADAQQTQPQRSLATVPARPTATAPAVTVPPPVADVLQSGVLIVVSKASQQMHVFKDGVLWQTSPVSTGRRGHATPSGVFPILQKAVFHRSTTYSGAPMPYMQRLTWRGIAIHAGHLPGYPASHGCIRVPRNFASALYGLTKASSTTVVITNQRLVSGEQAVALALAVPPPPRSGPFPGAVPTQLAQAEPAVPPQIVPLPVSHQPYRPSPSLSLPQGAAALQTIQLAASDSIDQAEAHWSRLIAARPELGRLQKAVIPAVVGSRRVYRLRVSAPDAYNVCAGLKSRGVPCFNVS